MTTKNILLTTTLSLVAILSIALIPNFEAFAEEEETGYKIAENVKSVMTFTFRDGVEVHEFPVYSITDDFVSSDGTSFTVRGVVGNSPHLYESIDQLYHKRLVIDGPKSLDYNYRYFDVDVDFLKDNEIFNTKGYYNCEVTDYNTQTLNSHDFESYTSSKSGFAIVDEIEFKCAGLTSENPQNVGMNQRIFIDYATEPLDYTFAEDVRSYVTFDFDNGMERIETHGFEINSGFGEENGAGPGFTIEYILDYYPLLEIAIEKARKDSGTHTSQHRDFNVKAEFANNEKVLRELDYADCRVVGVDIVTLTDKEEGFTGKSGFALVQQVEFSCAGLSGNNPGYDELRGDAPIWRTTYLTSNSPTHEYNVGHQGVIAISTFDYGIGTEIINFPIFEHKNVLDGAYPTFTVEGIVGDYPMLYKHVDDNLVVQHGQGASFSDLFDVDVDLVYDGESVRGFHYSYCRVIDYDVGSDMNKEESYIKGKFALENTFIIECQGYAASNPAYDAMFEVPKADNISTFDLRNTDRWGPLFTVQ